MVYADLFIIIKMVKLNREGRVVDGYTIIFILQTVVYGFRLIVNYSIYIYTIFKFIVYGRKPY